MTISAKEQKKHDMAIQRLKRSITQKKEEISGLKQNQEIEVQRTVVLEARIDQMGNAIRNKETRINGLRETLAEKEAHVKGLRRSLAYQRNIIEKLTGFDSSEAKLMLDQIHTEERVLREVTNPDNLDLRHMGNVNAQPPHHVDCKALKLRGQDV